MKFGKFIAAMAAVVALTAGTAFSSFAATVDGYNVDMYGKTTKTNAAGEEVEGYLLSDHVGNMVESISLDEDTNEYTVVFKPVDMGATAQGYISAISTSNGAVGSDIGSNKMQLVYIPANDTFNVIDSLGESKGTKTGTLINYSVKMTVGSQHTTSTGAIVIQ